LGRGRGVLGSKAGDKASMGTGGQQTRCPLQARLQVDLPLYAFVHPESGEVYWLILPTVNVELFSMALNEFAKEVGAGEHKRVLLVVDQAGWHTGKEVEIPEGIDLEFLPSGSPELQPAERLWPLTNEAVANGLFEEIEELEEALVERCLELLEQTESIRDLTNYHWWPQAA
jgi:transposase